MSNKAAAQRAFRITQRQLALWYMAITALMLILPGLAVHRLAVHAVWVALEREVQGLASIISPEVEAVLGRPGQMANDAQEQLSELCFSHDDCLAAALDHPLTTASISGRLYDNQLDKICIRLVDPDGRPVAWIQLPSSPDYCYEPQFWQTRTNPRGEFYHQLDYPLRTPDQATWGTMQIVQSIESLDMFLLWVELGLVGTILLAVVLAGVASWQLAGLAMRPVRQSYQQMEQFTTDAAHELRSPIATLRAVVQTALRAETLSPDEVQEILQILDRQSQRLSHLAQDLLLFGHINQLSPADTRIVCLDQMLRELVEEYGAIASTAHLALRYQPRTSQALTVLGYSEQLYRAVANLIGNALHYTPSGGQVTVTLADAADHALIQVIDTGIGIAAEDQSRIFDRFYRVSQDRSRHRGGVGLGLAIAQSIVQAHHGSLTVESALGQGSCFTVRLPLAKAD